MSCPGIPDRSTLTPPGRHPLCEVLPLRQKRNMAGEHDFIERLRAIATDPAARGLIDDAAVLEIGGTTLVLTHDALVEGVHFLASDPPESVARKLLAVNLSDLAAKGATPVAALFGHTLTGDDGWDVAFVGGLAAALAHFDVPLLGGDTVRTKERHLAMTLIGEAQGAVPSRAGGREGDALFVTGAIGDAGLGLSIARGELTAAAELLDAYRRPTPQLEAGRLLAPHVSAMMDVSDGLLIDASRLAAASGLAVEIDLDAVPLSDNYRAVRGGDRAARMAAATAGDDYQLLFAASLPLPALPCRVTRIGRLTEGSGLALRDRRGVIPPPASLGWEH